jgi:hypothetical protein
MKIKLIYIIPLVVSLILGIVLQRFVLKNYEITFQIDKKITESPNKTIVIDDCTFSKYNLPDDLIIYAGVGNKAKGIDYPIDDSYQVPGQFEVRVNSPNNPVGLILVGLNPAIWNISWTEGTEIKAVYVSGSNRQEVAGIPLNTPVINGTNSCTRLSYKENAAQKINDLSAKLFDKNANIIQISKTEEFSFGSPTTTKTIRYTSPDNPASRYLDKSKPRVGIKGLSDLVLEGKIRKATHKDLERWGYEIYKKYSEKMPPISPRIAPGDFIPKYLGRVYVVLDKITIPAGLVGKDKTTMFINKGAPIPENHTGHVLIYDFNSMKCLSFYCRAYEFPSMPKENESIGNEKNKDPDCHFGDIKFPKNMRIYAGGGYAGKKSEVYVAQADKFDVIVNSPKYPVALILGAYERSDWSVRYTPGTEIVGVFLTGYHDQTIKGLPKNTPLINSSYDNGRRCFSSHYIAMKNIWKIEPLSESLFGKEVTEIHFVKGEDKGKLSFGF